MADLISGQFLHNGVTKQMAVEFISSNMPYMSEAQIIITKFEIEGDEAKVDCWFKDKYFETRFMTGSRLIKENEQWKWYGNQALNDLQSSM